MHEVLEGEVQAQASAKLESGACTILLFVVAEINHMPKSEIKNKKNGSHIKYQFFKHVQE